MHILLADDNLETLKLFRLILELQGFQVEAVSDGAEAVQAVRHAPAFDVILLDMAMPQMDGLAAAQAIRALPRGRQAAILLVTAYEGKALATHLRHQSLEVDDFLFKPLLPQELVQAVHKANEGRRIATVEPGSPQPGPIH